MAKNLSYHSANSVKALKTVNIHHFNDLIGFKLNLTDTLLLNSSIQ